MTPHGLQCVVNRRRRRLQLAARADARARWASVRLGLLVYAEHEARGAGRERLAVLARVRVDRLRSSLQTDRAMAREHRAIAHELAAMMVDEHGGGWEHEKPHARRAAAAAAVLDGGACNACGDPLDAACDHCCAACLAGESCPACDAEGAADDRA